MFLICARINIQSESVVCSRDRSVYISAHVPHRQRCAYTVNCDCFRPLSNEKKSIAFYIFFNYFSNFFPKDADASTNTSTDESMNENADVTKQFKLREKRIEVKENITKKFVLDSVKMRTPKRRRIVRKNGNGKQPIVSIARIKIIENSKLNRKL